MSGPVHTWNFRPSLGRDGRTLLGLAVLAVVAVASIPRVHPAAITVAASPAELAGHELAADSAAWPRTALRLWFLVPQLLPRHDY